MKESEAIDLGRESQRGIDLMRDFCTNADIRVAVSPMGRAVGLPIGRAEIRCAHAPFFGLQMMQATDLAVEFYEANCLDCPHRQTTGRLPNIASEAAERARRRESDEEQRLRVRDAGRSAWSARNAARNPALADEPFEVRDLAAQIDLLDGDPEMAQMDEQRLDEARSSGISGSSGFFDIRFIIRPARTILDLDVNFVAVSGYGITPGSHLDLSAMLQRRHARRVLRQAPPNRRLGCRRDRSRSGI